MAITVPALLFYEVANILLFGRSRPPVDEAADALGDLYSIPIAVAAPAPDAANAALRLVRRVGEGGRVRLLAANSERR